MFILTKRQKNEPLHGEPLKCKKSATLGDNGQGQLGSRYHLENTSVYKLYFSDLEFVVTQAHKEHFFLFRLSIPNIKGAVTLTNLSTNVGLSE